MYGCFEIVLKSAIWTVFADFEQMVQFVYAMFEPPNDGILESFLAILFNMTF